VSIDSGGLFDGKLNFVGTSVANGLGSSVGIGGGFVNVVSRYVSASASTTASVSFDLIESEFVRFFFLVTVLHGRS